MGQPLPDPNKLAGAERAAYIEGFIDAMEQWVAGQEEANGELLWKELGDFMVVETAPLDAELVADICVVLLGRIRCYAEAMRMLAQVYA